MRTAASTSIEQSVTVDTPTSIWAQAFTDALRRWLRIELAQQRRIRKVETLPLGPRKAIHLIECDGQRFLVADGLGNLSRVHASAEEQGTTAVTL